MRNWLALLLTVLLCTVLVMSFADVGLAGQSGPVPMGGGPAPGCYVDYNGYPGVIHGNAGSTVYMEVYVSSCAATATTDWGSGQVTLFQDNMQNAVSWQYFNVPQNVVDNTTYVVNLDATDGTISYHTEARLVVGEPPLLSLQLTFGMKRIYWENYAAYQQRVLSVDYTVTNAGANDAYNVWLGENKPTNGVIAINEPFSFVSYRLTAGTSATVTRTYLLPQGVNSFKSQFGISAEDLNGHVHIFGSLPPTV